MAVRHWNSVVDGPLSEAALRAKLEGLGYRVARYVYEPGTEFPDHAHGMDKIDAVVSGRFRLVVAGHLFTLGPGDWLGEIALIDDGPRSATVTAKDEVRAAGMTAWQFKPFVLEHPEVAWQLLQTLAGHLREARK